ncbi:MAG: asparagine synthase-related protein, partial [Chloroflexi bacterium]|nr:asparagine synthase-related protein [Chloroflexota bacterium]
SQLREHLGAPPDRLTALPEAAEHWSPLKCLMYYMIRRILPEDMLVKVDRMSMACSLEVRAPFLDVDLAKVAMALPDRHLIRRGENKYILRRLAADRLPQVVLDHPKSGFSVPLHRVQNDAYREMADDLLGANDGPLSLLSVEMVNKTKGLALTRQRDMADASVFRISHQLWALMQLAAWGRRFGVTI